MLRLIKKRTCWRAAVCMHDAPRRMTLESACIFASVVCAAGLADGLATGKRKTIAMCNRSRVFSKQASKRVLKQANKRGVS